MKSCKFMSTLPGSYRILCSAYSHSKRYDGLNWAHYPYCENDVCPFVHPELVEKEAVLDQNSEM